MAEYMDHVCPFCGQAVMEDGDPREHCDCPDADRFRKRLMLMDGMRIAMDKYFGPFCSEFEPSWLPVDPAMYDWLTECVRTVVFMESCDKITVKIGDGSTAEISEGRIVRKMNLKREEKL